MFKIHADEFKNGQEANAIVTRFMEVAMDLGFLTPAQMEHVCAEIMNEENLKTESDAKNKLRWSIAYNLASSKVTN